MPHARRERLAKPRPKAEPPDLFHSPPPAALRLGDEAVAETRTELRRLRPHPRGVILGAFFLCGAVVAASSTFWFTVFQEDVFARAFFPTQGAGWIAIVCALWAAATQIALPLSVVRRLQTHRRLLFARSLQIVLAWGGTSAAVAIAAVATDAVSPRFAVAGAALAPAAWILFRLVRAALRADA